MKSRQPALLFIFVTLALDVFGFGLIIPVMPRLVASLRGSNWADAAPIVGALGSIYGLMQFLCAPLLGILSDRFGRRRVILISLAGSSADFLIQALAPNLPWLFVGRLLNGVSGANMSAASAYIADVTPPEKRAAGFGIIGAAFGLGFILGPLVGGWLALYGERVPFWGAAIITLANAIWGVFVLPESLKPENRRQLDWSRANPVGALAALRRFPVVLGLAASYFLMMLANFSIHSIWVLYTHERYQWDDRQVGVSLAVVGVVTAVSQMFIARAAVARLGERRALVLGMTVSCCNLVCYGLATRGWMIYAILLAGSISSIAGPSINSLISCNAPANEQGSLQGALTCLSSMATILAPILSTELFHFFVEPAAPVILPGAPLFAAAVMMAAALMIAARFLRQRAPRSEPAGSAAIPS